MTTITVLDDGEQRGIGSGFGVQGSELAHTHFYSLLTNINQSTSQPVNQSTSQLFNRALRALRHFVPQLVPFGIQVTLVVRIGIHLQ